MTGRHGNLVQEWIVPLIMAAIPLWVSAVVAILLDHVDSDWRPAFLAFISMPPACGFILLIVRILNYRHTKHPPDPP